MYTPDAITNPINIILSCTKCACANTPARMNRHAHTPPTSAAFPHNKPLAHQFCFICRFTFVFSKKANKTHGVECSSCRKFETALSDYPSFSKKQDKKKQKNTHNLMLPLAGIHFWRHGHRLLSFQGNALPLARMARIGNERDLLIESTLTQSPRLLNANIS